MHGSGLYGATGRSAYPDGWQAQGNGKLPAGSGAKGAHCRDVAPKKAVSPRGVAGIALARSHSSFGPEAAREMRAPVAFCTDSGAFRCISHGDVRLVDGTQLAVSIPHPSAQRHALPVVESGQAKKRLSCVRMGLRPHASSECPLLLPPVAVSSRSGTEVASNVVRRRSSSSAGHQKREAGLRWWSTI